MAERQFITAGDIRALIQESMEPQKPIDVINWLRQYIGKPITTRIATAANEAFPGEEFRIVRQYGMTYLENDTHRILRYETWKADQKREERAMYRKSISILLAHSEAAVALQERYLTEHNTCYTTGAIARNERRQKCLSGEHCQRLADAINAQRKAEAELNEALKVFGDDSYAINESFLKERAA